MLQLHYLHLEFYIMSIIYWQYFEPVLAKFQRFWYMQLLHVYKEVSQLDCAVIMG